MVNELFVPLTAVLLMQIELQSFVETLLNGTPRQIIQVAHSNDTIDLGVIESDYLVIIFMTENYVNQIGNLYTVFEHHSKAKMMWIFNFIMENQDIEYVFDSFHNFLHWYKLVLVHPSRSGDMLIKKRSIFAKTVEVMTHRDKRFSAPGALFEEVFKDTFNNNFDGRPFYVYGEPNLPKVALVGNNPSSKKYVTGSDVSLAIMMGRYLNASVEWITGWAHRNKWKQLPIEQRKLFSDFINPTIKWNKNVHDLLSWHLNTNKNE